MQEFPKLSPQMQQQLKRSGEEGKHLQIHASDSSQPPVSAARLGDWRLLVGKPPGRVEEGGMPLVRGV